MGYLNVLSIKLEAEFETKVELSGDGRNNGSMTINSVSVNDSAVYYCAAYHSAVDQLTYLQKPSSDPRYPLNHSTCSCLAFR